MSENGENDTGTSAPPERLVTVNQIVAWNIAWFRREAGLTQAGLAGLLGWPHNKVSEAERSVTGKRTREFDAQELIGLALALGVPLNAFFLPPLDDGQAVAYTIRPPGQGEDMPMRDLMTASLPDSEDESGPANAYRRRMLSAFGRYLDPDWRAEAVRWLLPLIGREVMLEAAFRMRGEEITLASSAGILDSWASAIEKTAGEEE